MKITKSQLKQIIKEELDVLEEIGSHIGAMGGMASGLSALGRPEIETPEDELDSQVQARAMIFLMNLGLDEKTSSVFVNNIAIPDLQTVMEVVPKIDTAAQEEPPLQEEEEHSGESCKQAHPFMGEVSSEKQRRWACAQKDKPASQRADSLSASEAEEMCKSQVEEKT